MSTNPYTPTSHPTTAAVTAAADTTAVTAATNTRTLPFHPWTGAVGEPRQVYAALAVYHIPQSLALRIRKHTVEHLQQRTDLLSLHLGNESEKWHFCRELGRIVFPEDIVQGVKAGVLQVQGGKERWEGVGVALGRLASRAKKDAYRLTGTPKSQPAEDNPTEEAVQASQAAAEGPAVGGDGSGALAPPQGKGQSNGGQLEGIVRALTAIEKLEREVEGKERERKRLMVDRQTVQSKIERIERDVDELKTRRSVLVSWAKESATSTLGTQKGT